MSKLQQRSTITRSKKYLEILTFHHLSSPYPGQVGVWAWILSLPFSYRTGMPFATQTLPIRNEPSPVSYINTLPVHQGITATARRARSPIYLSVNWEQLFALTHPDTGWGNRSVRAYRRPMVPIHAPPHFLPAQCTRATARHLPRSVCKQSREKFHPSTNTQQTTNSNTHCSAPLLGRACQSRRRQVEAGQPSGVCQRHSRRIEH